MREAQRAAHGEVNTMRDEAVVCQQPRGADALRLRDGGAVVAGLDTVGGAAARGRRQHRGRVGACGWPVFAMLAATLQSWAYAITHISSSDTDTMTKPRLSGAAQGFTHTA